MTRDSLGRYSKKPFNWAKTAWKALSLRRKTYLVAMLVLALLPALDKLHGLVTPQELIATRAEAAELQGLTGDRLDRKIAELKDEVLNQLMQCESGGANADSLVTFDPDKTGKESHVPSFGAYQWKTPSVQFYAKKLWEKDLSAHDAILLALDPVQARKLASDVIFETEKGGSKDWVVCFRNYNLETQVALIKALEN